jgi:hypothetical protein
MFGHTYVLKYVHVSFIRPSVCIYVSPNVCTCIWTYVLTYLHSYERAYVSVYIQNNIFIFRDNPRSFLCQCSLEQKISQNMISELLSRCNKQYLKLFTRSQNWHTKLELTGPLHSFCISFLKIIFWQENDENQFSGHLSSGRSLVFKRGIDLCL